jgi:cytochrome c oxidase cbb3-type subunit 3
MTLRLFVAVVALLALAACEREQRRFEKARSAGDAMQPIRQSPNPAGGHGAPAPPDNSLEKNAYAVAQGKQLYTWYNCNGCHAEGGGGSGPALVDSVWIYGSEPANIFATIVQGRPNGMPSFGGRIPEEQVWQLVAYVRSMSGQVDKDVAPGRNDALQAKKSENRVLRETPVNASPPTSVHP